MCQNLYTKKNSIAVSLCLKHVISQDQKNRAIVTFFLRKIRLDIVSVINIKSRLCFT